MLVLSAVASFEYARLHFCDIDMISQKSSIHAIGNNFSQGLAETEELMEKAL